MCYGTYRESNNEISALYDDALKINLVKNCNH